MRILIIHNILWAHYKSVFFQEMSSNLSGNNELHVVHIAKNELSRKNMDSQDNLYDYPYTVLFDDFIEHISPLKKTLALFKFILIYKPDVINVTGYAVDVSISLSVFFARLLGKKIILSNESIESPKPENPLKRLFKKSIIRCSNGFICFGTLAKQYMINLGAKTDQILEDKAAIVDDRAILAHYTSELTELKLANEIKQQHNFIFVGRFIEEKNLKMLLEVFKQLKEQYNEAENWGLILLGDGILKPELESLIKKSEISDVQMLPPVAWFEVSKYFAHADVLILPSKFEPWGLVVNEAMICGLPVIVSESCGCAVDLVDNNGYTFSFDNKLELLEAMHSLLDEKRRIGMGERSKEIISEYSVTTVAERLTEKILSLQ